MKEFTGISDPYEIPKKAEIVIDSGYRPPEDLVEELYVKIQKLGYI